MKFAGCKSNSAGSLPKKIISWQNILTSSSPFLEVNVVDNVDLGPSKREGDDFFSQFTHLIIIKTDTRENCAPKVGHKIQPQGAVKCWAFKL